MRLEFRIDVYSASPSNPTNGYFNLFIYGGSSGQAKYRIYKVGDPVPAFANMVPGSDPPFPNIATWKNTGDGSKTESEYIIDYEDDNGARQLAKAWIRHYVNTCFTPELDSSSTYAFIQLDQDKLSYYSSYISTYGGRITFDDATFYNLSAGYAYINEAAFPANPIPTFKVGRAAPLCSFEMFSEIETGEVYPALLANLTKSDTTFGGGSDGSITVNITSGSGDYTVEFPFDLSSYVLDSGSPAQSVEKTGLAAATYTVNITDNLSGQTLILLIDVLDPYIPVPSGDTIFFPIINSLHFVPYDVTPDACSVFQQMDNLLFCKQDHPYFKKCNYFQKVAKCDALPIQFSSNYESHVVNMYDMYGNDTGFVFIPTRKVQLIGVSETLPITIMNHGSGQSRVYFETSSIPILINPGDAFEITDNADGFNGTYSVVSINDDFTLGKQYLVINKNYAIIPTSTIGNGVFTANVLDFDIYEFVLNLGEVPDGQYYFICRGLEGSEEVAWISEPIDLRISHPNTNLIECRNSDNAFDVNYQTGITHRVRVESVFFKRLPSGERQILRNTTGDIVKLLSKRQRKVLFETFQLPPYLHEKLSIFFDHDFFSINGLQFQAEDSYEDPEYLTRYPLANSRIALEQVGLFRTYNGDDLGQTGNETGLLIVNEGFLKL